MVSLQDFKQEDVSGSKTIRFESLASRHLDEAQLLENLRQRYRQGC